MTINVSIEDNESNIDIRESTLVAKHQKGTVDMTLASNTTNIKKQEQQSDLTISTNVVNLTSGPEGKEIGSDIKVGVLATDSTNPSQPNNGDWRLLSESKAGGKMKHLHIDRYEDDTWKTKGGFDESITTDALHLKAIRPNITIDDNQIQKNLVRQITHGSGFDIGHHYDDMYLTTKENFYKIYPVAGVTTTNPIPDLGVQETITSMRLVDVVADELPDLPKGSFFALKALSHSLRLVIPDGEELPKIRMIINDLEDVGENSRNPIFSTGSKWDFENGNGLDITREFALTDPLLPESETNPKIPTGYFYIGYQPVFNVAVGKTLEYLIELDRPVLASGLVHPQLGYLASTKAEFIPCQREKFITESSASSGSIFITDITGSGNINPTRRPEPNEETIDSVQLESLDNKTITVEWDRAGEYEGLPTVNDIPVTKTGKIGNTYTGTALIPLLETKITAKLDTTIHEVLIDSLQKPLMTCEFTGSYPAGQTELKQGDVFELTVDTPDFAAIEIQQFGACQSFSGSTAVTNAVIQNTGVTAQDLTAKVRIQDSLGTWSDWTETTNTVKCNNLYPSISTSISYPDIQLALKDSEEAVITNTITNSDTDIASTTSNLTISTNGVTRASGDYEVGVYTMTSNRTANNATTSVNTNVRIAHVDVGLSGNDPVQVRSGVGAVALGCSFNQDLLFAFTNPTVTAVDSDLHSDTVLSHEITATNLANKVINLQRTYKIKGFAQKTLTLDYPAVNADIGCNAVNLANLVISGTINTAPPYDICQARVSTPAEIILVSQYALTDNQSDITISKQKCSDFGYGPSNNITIKVEEY